MIQRDDSHERRAVDGERRAADRRAARRHQVRLQVQLDTGEGVTRDFSLAGLYLLTPRPLELGEEIELKVAVPDRESPDPHWLRCQGNVVRVEPTDNGLVGAGVAFAPECLSLLQAVC